MSAPSTTSRAPTRTPLPMTDHRPAPYQGPSREEVLALRQKYLTPGLLTYYQQPLMIVEGHMQYVWDETGKQYLDAFAGIVTVSVGHCHPKIIAKVRDQVGKLQHTTTIYLHPTVALLGKKLADKMPSGSGLTNSYFTNSGSEANEVAILSAREFTKNTDVISLRNGYHGGTQAAMALTAVGTWKFKSSPSANVKHATPGYCYRCPYGLEYPSCDVKCARDVEELIRYETPGEVACVIAEPIQGVGGVVTPPPKEYFGIIYEIVRKHGGLCIADEVQTGFRPHGNALLGLRELGRDSRSRHPCQRTRQRRAHRRLRHPARDRRDDEEPRPLQHLRRQPDLDDPGPRDPRGDRRREHPGQRQEESAGI